MKTILVTGATRGIGCATAKRLPARGAHVLALSRDFSNFNLAGERCVRVPFELRATDARIKGRVVNIVSVACFSGHPDVWYGASKGAIMNLTKSLAKRYGAQGITANAIARGPTKNAIYDQLP
jgi:NAD(P)-dependent dehydrogenase (short-subunit alcohol dehydrogenase family)